MAKISFRVHYHFRRIFAPQWLALCPKDDTVSKLVNEHRKKDQLANASMAALTTLSKLATNAEQPSLLEIKQDNVKLQCNPSWGCFVDYLFPFWYKCNTYFEGIILVLLSLCVEKIKIYETHPVLCAHFLFSFHY